MTILKTCTACGATKTAADYYKRVASKDGLTPDCISCVKAAIRAWRDANPEQERAKAKAWRDANPDKIKAYNLRKYGLTIADYDAMIAAQGGVCAICHQSETSFDPKSGKVRGLAVDHCHATGTVRGLLCTDCNVSIGRMSDDPERLRRAADYVDALPPENIRGSACSLL